MTGFLDDAFAEAQQEEDEHHSQRDSRHTEEEPQFVL